MLLTLNMALAHANLGARKCLNLCINDPNYESFPTAATMADNR